MSNSRRISCILKPEPFDVFYARKDYVAAAADDTGQGIDDIADQRLHLLVRSAYSVDVELILTSYPIDLSNRLI